MAMNFGTKLTTTRPRER